MNCFKPLMKYHVIFIIPQLNSSGVLEIACFNKPAYKKSQILETTESGFGGG